MDISASSLKTVLNEIREEKMTEPRPAVNADVQRIPQDPQAPSAHPRRGGDRVAVQGGRLTIALIDRIMPAVVRLREGGQGVLVPGGLIVTAAHCLEKGESKMVLDEDSYAVKILAADGRDFTVRPQAVDRVNDLAVLAAVEDDVSFQEFCHASEPVQLALNDLNLHEEFTAYVFTHNKGILDVLVTQTTAEATMLSLESKKRINRGTSGGPVVSRAGRLLGIVSNVNMQTPCAGSIVRVHRVAPVWLVRRMVRSRSVGQ